MSGSIEPLYVRVYALIANSGQQVRVVVIVDDVEILEYAVVP